MAENIVKNVEYIYINPEIFSYQMEEHGGDIEIILKTKEILSLTINLEK